MLEYTVEMKRFFLPGILLIIFLGAVSCGAPVVHTSGTFSVGYSAAGSQDIGTVAVTIKNASGEIESFDNITLPWSATIERSLAVPGEAYLCVEKPEADFNAEDEFESIEISISINEEILSSTVRPDGSVGALEWNTKNWNGVPLFITENLWQYWDIDPFEEE